MENDAFTNAFIEIAVTDMEISKRQFRSRDEQIFWIKEFAKKNSFPEELLSENVIQRILQ